MIAALLIVLALAAPFRSAGDDCCPSVVDGVEDASAHPGTESLGQNSCDSEDSSEDSCPTGECCAVCVSCCKVAVRSFAPLGLEAIVDPSRFPPAVPSLYAANPGCSVWHPPRG